MAAMAARPRPNADNLVGAKRVEDILNSLLKVKRLPPSNIRDLLRMSKVENIEMGL